MSVETKIKELLERSSDQLTEAAQSTTIASGDVKPVVTTSKDTTVVASCDCDREKQPKQGSSEDPDTEELDMTDTVGAKASASIKKDTTIKATVESTSSEDFDISTQIDSIFDETLSEEFKAKATSIFEAAVIARVNHEMEKVIDSLEEQAEIQLQEQKDALVEKVDSFLNYVVEQWMDENALAIENGLKTEISEEFISGLKKLFQESYIDIPEEKFDLVGELQHDNEELETKLNEAIEQNISVASELAELKRQKIFEEQTKDLAATEIEKMRKLVEGVGFDSEELYSEKLSVIKESYFPKSSKVSPETVLIEEHNATGATFDDGSTMDVYVQALSRSIKAR